jgi:dolichol-phosphate mannosyltransferase
MGGDKMKPEVSVVLPTYNEAGNIVQLIREIKKEMKGRRTEFIVVDDNSPDGTSGMVRKLNDRSVKLILRKSERGLASAVLRGIDESRGGIVVLMDTDFSHPPEVIPTLVRMTGKCDMAFASRYVEGGNMAGSRLQYFLSKVFNSVIKRMLGIGVLDSTGGFFAARRAALASVDRRAFTGYGDYCFRMLYAAKRLDCRIAETPFSYRPRKSGSSKTNIAQACLSYLAAALRLRIFGL